MAVFTPVDLPQAQVLADRLQLGQVSELKGIEGGIENTNYFVTTTHGRYVLTLFEKLKAHELPFYIDLMTHLARHGIPCPQPIADRANTVIGALNGKPASIFTCVPGADLSAVDTAHCATIGELLAEDGVADAEPGRDHPRERRQIGRAHV